ncbi:three-Cys-motif partner protein TcmP [Luteimonas sp. SDU101]|uniref:three-Cys-motif partner protein TcmP n=1 Tax=Luteimonas sp. SDU101 TaxID=3422593 RepID=UPI003EB6F9A4
MGKGYAWTLNGPLPELDDHSRAKHDVLRAYVVNYLRILAQSPRSEGVRVTLVDGFAGGGQYRLPNGIIAPGSPLVLLDALREARARVLIDRQERGIRTPYVIDAQLHLVEQDKTTWQCLKAVIDGTPEANNAHTRVCVHHGSFDQRLPEILKDIHARQRKGGRSLFVLDQYGWSQVDLASVRTIFSQLPSAEVFLTWMIDNLINFLSEKNPAALQPALLKVGLGEHLTAEKLVKMKGNGQESSLTWRRAIQSLLAEEIRASAGANYCTPFYIVPRDSRRGYWLLHLAQHLRANEEMKRIHWQNNNLHHPGGPGFNMLGFIGSNGQLAFDNRFDEHAHRATVDALHEDIPRRLSQLHTPIRFGELMHITANETPAKRQQMQEAVFALAQGRHLILRTESGANRRMAHSLKDEDVIELPMQLWLLPG